MNRLWLIALVALISCGPSPKEKAGNPVAAKVNPEERQGKHEQPKTGIGECRELGWAPPNYPAAYRNSNLQCAKGAVVCSYRCVIGCDQRSDMGCPDFPVCVDQSLCRPGGQVTLPPNGERRPPKEKP